MYRTAEARLPSRATTSSMQMSCALPNRRRSAHFFGVVGVITSLLLAGCTSGSDESAVTSSGQVDFVAYERAFLKYKDCLQDKGYTLLEVKLDNAVKLYSYSIPGPAEESGSSTECYESTGYEAADVAWQTSPDRPKPAYQSLSAIQVASECLERRGVVPDERATFDELVNQLLTVGVAFDVCIEEAQGAHP